MEFFEQRKPSEGEENCRLLLLSSPRHHETEERAGKKKKTIWKGRRKKDNFRTTSTTTTLQQQPFYSCLSLVNCLVDLSILTCEQVSTTSVGLPLPSTDSFHILKFFHTLDPDINHQSIQPSSLPASRPTDNKVTRSA